MTEGGNEQGLVPYTLNHPPPPMPQLPLFADTVSPTIVAAAAAVRGCTGEF